MGLGLAAEAAEKRRPKGVPVVDEDVVVGALGAHAAEAERDELVALVRLDQPLAVAVLGVVGAHRAVGDDAPRVGEHATGLVARHEVDGGVADQNKQTHHDSC